MFDAELGNFVPLWVGDGWYVLFVHISGVTWSALVLSVLLAALAGPHQKRWLWRLCLGYLALVICATLYFLLSALTWVWLR